MTDINYEELLSRERVDLTDGETAAAYRGKTVLVTGCGTVGSALMRRLAALSPKTLIGVDIYENNLYELHRS